MGNEVRYLKEDIAFDVIIISHILDSMANDQRLLDEVRDEELILIIREMIFEQENLCREIMEGVRAKQARITRIKRLEQLSGAGPDHIEPRTDPGAREPGITAV